jgi:hypothetical protein
MKEVPLYRPDGVHVTTVLLPVGGSPEVLLWGSRVFRLGLAWEEPTLRYQEVESLQVYTPAEHEAMKREGIVA